MPAGLKLTVRRADAALRSHAAVPWQFRENGDRYEYGGNHQVRIRYLYKGQKKCQVDLEGSQEKNLGIDLVTIAPECCGHQGNTQ